MLTSCKKTDGTNAVTGGTGATGTFINTTPAATDSGQPVGTAVNKIIGPAGGTIVSSDGQATLAIPAGALTVSTNISIVPISNSMPGGMGLAYSFLPNGTKFNTPATLTFHYDITDGDDNSADSKYIAYQDSAGRWRGNIVDRDYDTVAQTISLGITHFTRYAPADGVRLRGAPLVLHAGESVNLHFAVTHPWTGTDNPLDDPDLALLPTNIDDKYLGAWYVQNVIGGNATVGTVEGNNSNAIYHAPANINQEQTVYVATHIRIPENRYKKGKPLGLISAPFKGVYIKLLPAQDYNFAVTITVIDSNIAPDYYHRPNTDGTPAYSDQVKLNIKITGPGLKATVDTMNFPPSCTPAASTEYGTNGVRFETFTWLADDVGELNVVKVTLNDPTMPLDSVLTFNLTHANTMLYGFKTEIWGINGGITATQVVIPQPWPDAASGGGGVEQLKIDLKKTLPYSTVEGAFGQYTIINVVGK